METILTINTLIIGVGGLCSVFWKNIIIGGRRHNYDTFSEIRRVLKSVKGRCLPDKGRTH